MRSLRSTKNEKKVTTSLVDQGIPNLKNDQILIRAEYSSLNYKDALGVTGKGQIFKVLPITGGIDVAGTVEKSNSPRFNKGEKVLITGCGLGETRDGGYSEYVVDHEKNVVKIPAGLSTRDVMIYGTAGFTAALCVERMMQNGQIPEMGPILVTGASGGVGQFAVSFFSQLGFEVHALTSKQKLISHLKKIGANEVILTSQFELGNKPLESVRFGGAVDNLGGDTLSRILAHTQLWGNVACVGLAASHELHTTVMPLILRGVSLLGISSNNTNWDLRIKIWQRLSSDLKPKDLDSFISDTIGLNEIVSTAENMIAQKTYGRTIVKIQ
ncbi:MAG: YhdH/YhfP family quinone oxidoreductase [Bdellovibrionales bacterium]|nr:YhdH/YhfP family quinone oxidoreductase [Bdellovibrionales bacterium]